MKKRAWLWVLGLFLAIGAVFGPVVTHDFVPWDDDMNLYGNPRLNPVTPQKIALFWTTRYFDTYRPVTGTVIGVLAFKRLPHMRQISGTSFSSTLDPRPYRVASLSIHFLTAVGVLFLLRILLVGLCPDASPTTREMAAGLGALLWAVHPAHVETVAWATAITDLLKGFFAVWALVFYAHFLRNLARNRSTARFFLAATVFFVLGLLSHPAVTFVPLLAAIIAHFWAKIPPQRWGPGLVLWLALALPFALAARSSESGGAAQTSPTAANVEEPPPPLALRPVVALDALAFYARHIAIPYPLTFNYGRTPSWTLGQIKSSPLTALALLTAPILFVLAWRARKLPGIALGTLFFLLALFPNLGLLPFRFQAHSTVADRYLYLPLIGLILIATVFIILNLSRGRWLAGGLVVFWAILSATGLPIWQNARSLFSHQVEVVPQSPVGWLQLGNVQLQDGDLAGAQKSFEQALVVFPHWPDAKINLASVLTRGEKWQAARLLLNEVLRDNPNSPDALLNLAEIELKTGHPDRAIALNRRAVVLWPENPLAHNNLGQALLGQDQIAEATAQFRAVLETRPDLATAWAGLGEALARQNQAVEAEKTLQHALELNSNDARSLYNLAQLRNAAGDHAGALEFLLKSVQLDPKVPEARESLGIALSRAGRAADAEGVLQQLVKDFPAFASGRYSLGVVLAQREAFDEAAQQWREVLRREPKFEPAREALAKLAKG